MQDITEAVSTDESVQSDTARAGGSSALPALSYPQPQFDDADDIANRFSGLHAPPDSPQPVFASAIAQQVLLKQLQCTLAWSSAGAEVVSLLAILWSRGARQVICGILVSLWFKDQRGSLVYLLPSPILCPARDFAHINADSMSLKSFVQASASGYQRQVLDIL